MRSIFRYSWCLLLLFSCEADQINEETDTFSNTPSEQIFTINTARDTILFGEEGIRLFIPANSFVDQSGEETSGEINLELIEAISLADQLLMGAAGENQLGIVKLEARQYTQQLSVKPGAKIILQLPARGARSDYELSIGEVRKNGKIRWKQGKQSRSFLVPEDFANLPFHPEEFREELSALLPFGRFQDYSIELGDSLYFSFAGGDVLELTEGFRYTKMNEPYYHRHHVFRDGEYTPASFDRYANHEDTALEEEWPVLVNDCGIDPAKVRALKSPDFAETLLATTAFTERLATILSLGDEQILDIYLQNLEQEMWQIDQQAAAYLEAKGDSRSTVFRQFALQGLTNTQEGAAYADLLSKTLADRMARFAEELSQQKEKIITALNAKNEQVALLKEEYRQLLWKREQHRMRYLSFELDELGWFWPGRSTAAATDTVAMVKLVAQVANARKYDELYLYTVLPYAKSIYALNTDDGATFYPGITEERRLYQLLNKQAKVVAVGYRNDKLFIGETDYRVELENQVELRLKPSNRRRLNALLNKEEGYLRDNRMSVDLPYLRALRAEEKRQNQLWEEQYALYFLGAKAYPNCNSEPSLAEAKMLFSEHCGPCHAEDLKADLTGPALINGPAQYSKMWFTRFTENSQHMIATGDARATEQWRRWGPTTMNSFAGELTKAEISAIYRYIQSER